MLLMRPPARRTGGRHPADILRPSSATISRDLDQADYTHLTEPHVVTLLDREAGDSPAGTINPAVHEAMAEVGLDLSEAFPKPLTDEAVRAADVVITMGCGDACPVYPGKRYLNWELDDPAGKPVEAVRGIRDDIDRRVRSLLTELVTGPG